MSDGVPLTDCIEFLCSPLSGISLYPLTVDYREWVILHIEVFSIIFRQLSKPVVKSTILKRSPPKNPPTSLTRYTSYQQLQSIQSQFVPPFALQNMNINTKRVKGITTAIIMISFRCEASSAFFRSLASSSRS